jgi:hypothetical protein
VCIFLLFFIINYIIIKNIPRLKGGRRGDVVVVVFEKFYKGINFCCLINLVVFCLKNKKKNLIWIKKCEKKILKTSKVEAVTSKHPVRRWAHCRHQQQEERQRLLHFSWGKSEINK